jgi:hypothetical protein
MGIGLSTGINTLELVVPDVAKAHYNDGQIVVYSVTNTSPICVNAFFDDIIRIQQQWDRRQPYLALYDFSRAHRLQLTNSFREGAIRMARANPKTFGRTAFLLPALVSAHWRPLWFFIKRDLPGITPQMEYDVQPDGKFALQWLREMLYQ